MGLVGGIPLASAQVVEAQGIEAQVVESPATQSGEVDSQTDSQHNSHGNSAESAKGQSDLDEAIVKRIDADSPESLEAVAALLESAIQKGLDEENKSFAEKMLGSVLLQQAQGLAAKISKVQGRQRLKVRDQALRVLEDAVKNDPSLVEGFLLIARLNLMGGGNKEAIFDATSSAIELLNDSPIDQSAAYVLRALTQDSEDEKLVDLDAALDAHPKNKEALQLRAGLRLQVGNIEGAIKDLETVLVDDPTNEVVAGTAIEKLIELDRVKDAIELIGKTLAVQPSEGMYRMRAILYQADGNLDEAVADLDKAIAMAPKDPRTLLQRASIALDRDDVKSAKADFRAATTLAPQILSADQGIELRLQIAIKENRMADAINDAKLMVERDPQNTFRRMRLASLYSIDKRPRKAIDLLSSILQDEPDDVPVLRSRGDALLSVGDHASAIDDYEKAISALGNVDVAEASDREIDEASGLYNNLAWVLATSPNDTVRNGNRALELAELSAKLTQYEAPHILSTLAAAYAEKGDYDNAVKWSQKSVDLGAVQDPDHTEEQFVELKEQLQAELDNYKDGKPWREKKDTEENDLPILDPADLIDT